MTMTYPGPGIDVFMEMPLLLVDEGLDVDGGHLTLVGLQVHLLLAPLRRNGQRQVLTTRIGYLI